MGRFWFFIITAAVLILVSAGMPLPASAGTATFTPFASVRCEKDDNIVYAENDKRSDFITTVTGGAKIKNKTERLDFNIAGDLRRLIFDEYDALDTLDKYASFGFNYQLSQRWSFGGGGQWKHQAVRGDDEDDQGLPVLGNRVGKSANLDTRYIVSEISQVSFNVNAGQTKTYEADNDEDNRNGGLSFEYSHNLSRYIANTIGYIRLNYYYSYSQVDYPYSTYYYSHTDYQSDIYQMSVGFSKELTQLWQVYLHGGVGESRTKENVTTTIYSNSRSTEVKSDPSSWVATGGVNYTGQYLRAGLSLSHDLRAGSGTDGTVERSRVSFNMSYRVTDKFTLLLDASSYLNKSERKEDDEDDDLDTLNYTCHPHLRYRFLDDFNLSLGYRYSSTEDRIDDTVKARNIVYLEVKKNFTYDID